MQRGRVASLGLAAAMLAGSLVATPPSTVNAATTGAGQPGLKAGAGRSESGVDWGGCPADVTAKYPVPVPQCATVMVPLDYRKPGGAKIGIMISRLASAGPARRGILVTNPGGPGGEGLSMPGELVSLGLPTSVLDAYDVIGMDPRGVGHSSPVSCGFTQGQEYADYGNVPPYAADTAAVTKWAGVVKGVAAQCAAADRDKGLLRHISTANTARDLDSIRAALGEEKLNYFGGSYGTVLGAAYAAMFPQHSGRVILDSNSGGTALDRASQRRFGEGFELRFPDFAKFVAARSTAYGLGRTTTEVRRNFLRFAERLDRRPVLGVTGAAFRLQIFAGLYDDDQFAPMAQRWQGLAASAGTSAKAGAARTAAAPVAYDNSLSAYLAVVCNDSAWPKDVAAYQRDVAADRKKYPLFGAAGANIMPCAFWSTAPSEPQVKITDRGPKNVLLLQNLRDPGTPYAGALRLHQAFGDRSRLVTVDQGGHGAYVYSPNACVFNVATAYLVDGTWPKRDVFCKAS